MAWLRVKGTGSWGACGTIFPPGRHWTEHAGVIAAASRAHLGHVEVDATSPPPGATEPDHEVDQPVHLVGPLTKADLHPPESTTEAETPEGDEAQGPGEPEADAASEARRTRKR